MAAQKLFDPGSDKPFPLSRSKVGLFLDCPRCFYLDRRLGIGRPAGFPFNLNSAVDALLKREFDDYRAQGKTHPLISGENFREQTDLSWGFPWLIAVMLALLLAAGAAPAQQQYPARPIRLIVPFPPGGAVDVIARIVAPRLSERLGQQVVVDNRGGANAIIGTEITAHAAPDGYTILIVPAGHAITPAVTRKLPYDSVRDFAAIGLIGNGAYVLVVNPSLPARTVGEFVTLAKARPGQLNYASTGHGNATHLAAELFKVLAGIDMVGVYYKGGGPALTDVIGGHVSAFFSGVASGSAQIRAGKVRALGVTTARRTAALPEVPTLAEGGVAGYEFDGWYGLLAPAATPPAIIARLNRELAALVSSAEMKERLLAAGIDARASSPAEFRDRIASDIARWPEVVKKARIAVE